MDFLKDAKNPEDSTHYKNFNLDVIRAHLNVGKEYYLLFEFLRDNDGVINEELIKFLGADYTFRLGPLTASSHPKMDRSEASSKKTALAMAKWVHLYQLLQLPLESRNTLEKAFKDKTVIYDGEEIALWEDLDDDIRDEWIRRWKWVKDNPDASGQGAQFMCEDPFLNEFYPDWYTHRYLPEMRDYRAYLTRNPSCKLPEFWDWFLNVYSRDNRYP